MAASGGPPFRIGERMTDTGMTTASKSDGPRVLGGGWLGTILSTVGVFAFVVPGTVIFALLAILTSWIPPRGLWVTLVARLWARCLVAAAGVRVEVELDPAIDPARGYVFLANHQSYFDIPALLATLPGQVRFAAKRSLFRIPIFGWSLAAGGFIPVDRADRSQARDVFAAAGERLREGISVLFFPEGTRSADGRLLPFQRGGFLVALKSGLPVVPVGISGAREVLPRHTLVIRPGTIRIRYGQPIETSVYGVRRRSELTGEVRRRITELAGLAAGAAGAVEEEQ